MRVIRYVLRLYDYVASANCYKVRLLLAQLELPYERVAVDIFDGGTLTDEFARLNPLRSTPALQLPDGRVLIESNAILWFLAAGSPFLPDDAFAQAEVCRWLIYEQSDVMPMIGGLRFRLVTGRVRPQDRDANRRRAGALETLADYPSVVAWLARVKDQPRFMDDLEPYPANARPGAGRSIYDA